METIQRDQFTLLSEASPPGKWQSVCSYALLNRSQAVVAAMVLNPVATASALQLAASCSNDLGSLVVRALQSASADLPFLVRLKSVHNAGMDLSHYMWEATEDDRGKNWKAAPPQSPRTGRPAPRPPLRFSPLAACALADGASPANASQPRMPQTITGYISSSCSHGSDDGKQNPLKVQGKATAVNELWRLHHGDGEPENQPTHGSIRPVELGGVGIGFGGHSGAVPGEAAPCSEMQNTEHGMLDGQWGGLPQRGFAGNVEGTGERCGQGDAGVQSGGSGAEDSVLRMEQLQLQEKRQPQEAEQLQMPAGKNRFREQMQVFNQQIQGVQCTSQLRLVGPCDQKVGHLEEQHLEGPDQVKTELELQRQEKLEQQQNNQQEDEEYPHEQQRHKKQHLDIQQQQNEEAEAVGLLASKHQEPLQHPSKVEAAEGEEAEAARPLAAEAEGEKHEVGELGASASILTASGTPPVSSPTAPSSLFDVLRILPAEVITRNLLDVIGLREGSALRLLSHDWDVQVRKEWMVSLRLVLREDCVRELQERVRGGSHCTLAARYPAVSRLQLVHRRIDRTIFPNTTLAALNNQPASGYGSVGGGSSLLLEMPLVVVDDAPPLQDVLTSLVVAPFGSRLRHLHLSSDATAVSELDLGLMAALVPELEELVVRFDCFERPAPQLWVLQSLRRLQRLGVLMSNSKLNFDPAPERLISSLEALTGLRGLSLELTTSSLPLPTRCLARLSSLRLAVVFRGYTAGQQSEQLHGLVGPLGHLTALQALAIPDGYRGTDGDLLRAASWLLPSLTALHMPRLSVTQQELQALARLPLLQHVTLGSLNIAPDEDYQDLLPYNYNAGYDNFTDTPWTQSATPKMPPLYETVASDVDWHPYGSYTIPFTLPGPLQQQQHSGTAGILISEGKTGGGGGGATYAAAANRHRGCGTGLLSSMTSWRCLYLCEDQRMEALVAAGPLPGGLRELRVDLLRWPSGSRADSLSPRGVATLEALCADIASLQFAAVYLSLDALPGAATASFNNTAAGSSTAAVAMGGGSAHGRGTARRRHAGPYGCVSVPEVVLTSCRALGRIPGLRTLRWSGLLPLVAHLGGAESIALALGEISQVSELEILGGLRGLHPASSPLFLVHLARALEAMTALRRLGLSCGAPHTDGLAQGLPGFLVVLRVPLRVEAGFVTREDALVLRALMARSAPMAPCCRASNSTSSAAHNEVVAHAAGDGRWAAGWGGGSVRAAVVQWEDCLGAGAGEQSAKGSGFRDRGVGCPEGQEARSCFGGWKSGGGLWWVPLEEHDEETVTEGEGRGWW